MVMPPFVGWIVRSRISKRPVRRSGALLTRAIALSRSSQAFGQCSKRNSGARSPVAINELVCDVVSTSLGELKSRRVSLALQLLDDLTPVQVDRVQLQQVLLNLLTNAIDSMAAVTDRPHMLCVRSEHLEDWVLISVQDSGTGIAPEHAERIVRRVLHNQTKWHWARFVYRRSIV